MSPSLPYVKGIGSVMVSRETFHRESMVIYWMFHVNHDFLQVVECFT